MDRFIVVKYGDTDFKRKDLKSNMDRFIGYIVKLIQIILNDLKSNMDRFIGYKISKNIVNIPI